MVGLDTEWYVEINLGQENFMYRGLPTSTATTLAELADYAINKGWVRTSPPVRGDERITIRGSIIRRLMRVTGREDKAVACTLQPLTSQFSSDGNESESWSEVIEMRDDIFEDDVTSDDDLLNDSDFVVEGIDDEFDDIDELEYFDINPEENLVETVLDTDLVDFELIHNTQWEDTNMVYENASVDEEPLVIEDSDSDYYDIVRSFREGGSGDFYGSRALPADSE